MAVLLIKVLERVGTLKIIPFNKIADINEINR